MNFDTELPTKRAAGILLFTQATPKQFLLMRHQDRWDLPKGHCDPGETDLQTALRETEEETGISRQSIHIDSDFRFELSYSVRYSRHGNRVFQKTVVYLLGEIATPVKLSLTEHASYQWIDWNPPHQIQSQTIDPLLHAVEKHFAERKQSSQS